MAMEDMPSPRQKALCRILHQVTSAAIRVGGMKRANDLLGRAAAVLDHGYTDWDSLIAEVHALQAEVFDLDGEPGEAAVLYAGAAEAMEWTGYTGRSGELYLAAAYAYMDAGMPSRADEHFRMAQTRSWSATWADIDLFAQVRLASIDLRPDSAEQILEQVRGLLPRITDPLVIGYYHNLQGRRLASNGRASEAFDQLLMAVQTLDTLPTQTLRQAVRLAGYLANAAYCARHAGRWQQCVDLASRSVVVVEAVLAKGDPFVERTVRDVLSTVLETHPLRAEFDQRYGTGVERKKHVLALRLARAPLDSVGIAKNYRNIAADYQEFDGAHADSILKYATICLAWPSGPETSSAHQLRAFAMAHKGRYGEAMEALAKGLAHLTGSGSFIWEELDRTSFVAHVRIAEILDDFARVLAIIDANGHRKNEHLLDRFSQRQCDVIDSLFMVEGVDVSRLVTVRNAVHDRLIRSNWPAEGASPSLDERDQVLAWMDDDRSLLFRREQFLMEQSGQQAHRDQLYALRERKERLLLGGRAETHPQVLKTSLRIDSLQQLLADIRPTGPLPPRPTPELGRRIRAALPQRTALLEYKLTGTEVLIALVRSNGVVLDRIQRTPVFDRALSLFTSPVRSNDTIPNILSEQALQPLQTLLPGEIFDGALHELIIVPDKELSYVPFEAIPVVERVGADQGKAIVDLFNVRYALSARAIAEDPPVSGPEEHAVFAFAPDYQDGRAGKAAMRSANLLLDSAQRERAMPLLHNVEEVEGIQAIVRASAITGAAVSEQSIKDRLGRGDLLHFAMHGCASSDPMRSGLVIRSDAHHGDAMRGIEVGSISDDGVLHAFELLTRRVKSPLVVLSACETGHGPHQDGEGVRSLARSFMLAGAGSTVSSLWKVDDRATKEIMVKFYEYLADGMGKADALAEAKRWYRRENPNAPPSHWAAFILIGDNEPINLKKRSPVRPWMWLIGGLAVLLAGYGVRRMRTAA